MATNHPHHQCHCHPTTTTTYHCTMCYTATHYPPPPPNQVIHTHDHQHQYQYQYHQHSPQIHQPQSHQENVNPSVSSLIRRISALESTLRRKQSPSLRDAAARTIQTHFRAYLVQRSVTLRHLQHLAHIKSALNRLKSSHLHPHTVSRQSMALLIKLDSIQGSDPMIRDGKRSISRELIRFMELTEKQVKNAGFGKKAGSRVFGFQERKFLENLKNARKCCVVENGSSVSQTRKGNVKRNVSFDDDGNVYRLFKNETDDSNGDGEEEVEVEEVGVSLKDTQVEQDESSEMSGNEMDPRKNLRTRVHHRIKKNQPDQEEDDDDEGDSFVFSAPLPAKMEY